MFLLNNFIILCIVILIVYFYKKNEIGSMLIALLSAYCWMPVLQVGSFCLNSSYILTLLLVCLMIYEIIQKKFILKRIQSLYLLIMLAGIGVSMLGWVINGNPKLADVFHFAGMSQYIVAAVGVSYFVNQLKEYAEVKSIVYTLIKIGILINFVFLVIQFMNPDFGYYLTKQLYVYGDRAAPLNEMAYWGKFTRGFGSNFAPYLLGIFGLMSAGFIMSDIIESDNKLLSKSILIFIAVSLGILAFSKIVILGIFIIYVFYIFQEIFYKGSNMLVKTKHISVIGLAIILSFWLVALAGNFIGLKGQVNYYYNMLRNPLQAISSRLHVEEVSNESSQNNNNNNIEEQKGIKENQESKEGNKVPELSTEEKSGQGSLTESKQANSEEGKEDKKIAGSTAGALEVFLNHPIIGVGPASIQGEFIGDSQIVSVLHDGGIIYALLYLIFYGGIFIYYCMKRKYIQCMLILCLFLGCIAIPVFVYSITIPFMALCLIDNMDVKSSSYQEDKVRRRCSLFLK